MSQELDIVRPAPEHHQPARCGSSHERGSGMTHIDDPHFPHTDHCDDHGPTVAVAETSTGG